MNKAEEFALKALPKEIFNDEISEKIRIGMAAGYQQAEQDLEPTWKDINDIKLLTEQVECDYVEIDKKLYTNDFYEEVLKRFKERTENGNKS